jgi:hypothetical protein
MGRRERGKPIPGVPSHKRGARDEAKKSGTHSLIDDLRHSRPSPLASGDGDPLATLGSRVPASVLRRVEGYDKVGFMVVVAAGAEADL